MGLTEEEKNLAMVIAGKVSGAISIISSTFIVRDIYTKWKAKRRSDHLPPTTLLVLSMSLGDIGSSFFAFFLGSWMVPTEGDFPLAAGTEATCDAQAFLFGVFFGSSNMTNGIMALVYWLVICREKPEKDLRAWYWHGLMFGYPWLWGIVYAAVCSLYTLAPAEAPLVWYCYGIPSEPGTKGVTIYVAVVSAFFIATAILIILSMGALVRFVHKQEQRMDRFRRQDSQLSWPPSVAGNSTTTSITLANRARTIQVAQQGFLFTLAFLVISVPIVINGISFHLVAGGDYSQLNLPMGYYVFGAVLFPLQGFMNGIVYFRPKFAANRQKRGLTYGQATLMTLGLKSYARKDAVSELTPPGDGQRPAIEGTEGSTFEGEVKRMSVVQNAQAIAEMGEIVVDESAVEDEAGSPPATSKRKSVGFRDSLAMSALTADGPDSFAENDS